MLATDKKKSKKEKIKNEEKKTSKSKKNELEEELTEDISDKIDKDEKEINEAKTINFCKICDTVYYPKIENDKLIYICRNCGNKDISNNRIVHRNDYRSDNIEVDPKDIINSYLRYDNTIPRTNKVTCPYCSGNKALFFKYNNNDMALLYLCLMEGCDRYWIK